MSNIPSEWWKYQQSSAYFITYFGEIYYGSLWKLHDYPDRFFIVQNDKHKAIRELKREEQTLEKYQQLGREIKDVGLIKQVIATEFGREIAFKPLRFNGYQQFKKMFVFGAAASAFCTFGDAKEKFRKSALSPPTGFEIFDEKYEDFVSQFPAAKLSIPLFESKNKNIEECMEDEWQKFKSYYSPKVAIRHINIQFYLQALFKEISKEVVAKYYRHNLYSLFLNKFQAYLDANPNEKLSLVSFNYDTILDDFISAAYGYSFKNINDYIDWDERNVLLFKPHGSCNWGWKLKKDQINGNTQNTIAAALYDANIEPWQVYFQFIGSLDEVVAQNTWGHEYHNDKHSRGRFTINKNLIKVIPENTEDVFFPSLLIPYRDKDEMLMPYDHFNAMQHSVSEMEELYVIGWKGNEDLFNKQLKDRAHRLKKIVIVNPEPEVVKSHLKEYIDISKLEIVEINNFETFVLQHLDNILA